MRAVLRNFSMQWPISPEERAQYFAELGIDAATQREVRRSSNSTRPSAFPWRETRALRKRSAKLQSARWKNPNHRGVVRTIPTEGSAGARRHGHGASGGTRGRRGDAAGSGEALAARGGRCAVAPALSGGAANSGDSVSSQYRPAAGCGSSGRRTAVSGDGVRRRKASRRVRQRT